MGDLSVGVVGLGLGRHFLDACRRSQAVGRLVVCDADAAAIERVRAAGVKIDAAYADVDEMLAAEGLDAACVVTPDHLHRPHAEACLMAGCHVLLTKPLATNLGDGRAIVHAADATGAKLMVAHERRFRPANVAVKRMIDAGELGEVIELRIDAIQDKRRQFTDRPWYASAEAGRTALVGSGIHEVDLVRWFAGRPVESVFAFSNRLGTLRFPADKTTAALFRFAGGAVGQVTVTYEAHWPPDGGPASPFRTVGSKGVVIDGRFALDGDDRWRDLPASDRPAMVDGVHGCVADFLDAIVRDRPVSIPGPDAFASLAAAVAADQSAASGAPVVPVTYESF